MSAAGPPRERPHGHGCPSGPRKRGNFLREGRLEPAALWALPVPAAGHAVCVAPGTLALFSPVSAYPNPPHPSSFRKTWEDTLMPFKVGGAITKNFCTQPWGPTRSQMVSNGGPEPDLRRVLFCRILDIRLSLLKNQILESNLQDWFGSQGLGSGRSAVPP